MQIPLTGINKQTAEQKRRRSDCRTWAPVSPTVSCSYCSRHNFLGRFLLGRADWGQSNTCCLLLVLLYWVSSTYASNGKGSLHWSGAGISPSRNPLQMFGVLFFQLLEGVKINVALQGPYWLSCELPRVGNFPGGGNALSLASWQFVFCHWTWWFSGSAPNALAKEHS